MSEAGTPPAASARLGAGLASGLDRALRLAVDIPAGLILAAEILLLGASIAARAAGIAMVWSEELESILFLWLAMLGSVIALREGGHMRVTALVTRLPSSLRGLAEARAYVAHPVLGPRLLEAARAPVEQPSDGPEAAADPAGHPHGHEVPQPGGGNSARLARTAAALAHRFELAILQGPNVLRMA